MVAEKLATLQVQEKEPPVRELIAWKPLLHPSFRL